MVRKSFLIDNSKTTERACPPVRKASENQMATSFAKLQTYSVNGLGWRAPARLFYPAPLTLLSPTSRVIARP